MTYSICEKGVFDWSTGETLDKIAIVDKLNKQEILIGHMEDLIDDKIEDLEGRYAFGQKYGVCPMHNIQFGINILNELQKELKQLQKNGVCNHEWWRILQTSNTKSHTTPSKM